VGFWERMLIKGFFGFIGSLTFSPDHSYPRMECLNKQPTNGYGTWLWHSTSPFRGL